MQHNTWNWDATYSNKTYATCALSYLTCSIYIGFRNLWPVDPYSSSDLGKKYHFCSPQKLNIIHLFSHTPKSKIKSLKIITFSWLPELRGSSTSFSSILGSQTSLLGAFANTELQPSHPLPFKASDCGDVSFTLFPPGNCWKQEKNNVRTEQKPAHHRKLNIPATFHRKYIVEMTTVDIWFFFKTPTTTRNPCVPSKKPACRCLLSDGHLNDKTKDRR